MYSVFLAFNREHPDAEDEAVEAYLTEQELIPVVVKGKCQGELSSDFVSGAILLWKDRRRFKVL